LQQAYFELCCASLHDDAAAITLSSRLPALEEPLLN